jgi:hypothetical protein
MLELFYNYESWINDPGAIFDMVMNVALASVVVIFILGVFMKSESK